MADPYSPPLRVFGFTGTKRGDPDRGPQVRMRSDEAALRMLVDKELVRVVGPRRHELATLVVDDSVPRGEVLVRDIAGIAPSEVVRIRKVELDLPPRHLG